MDAKLGLLLLLLGFGASVLEPVLFLVSYDQVVSSLLFYLR